MILRQSHSVIWVLDHKIAYDFYVDKLGLEVRMDHTMEGGFRWLTVGAPTDKDHEIVLMLVDHAPTLDDSAKSDLKRLIEAGAMGCGVLAVDDCRKTYAELVAKGVKFKGEPIDQFYGTEALMIDPFGNWFSMNQHKF